MYAGILFFSMLVASLVVYKIYTSTEHTSYDCSKLRDNAKIVSVDIKTVGLKGGYKYRTTVTFDDSFVYISHKGTDRTDHLLYYEISLPPHTKQEIINKAIIPKTGPPTIGNFFPRNQQGIAIIKHNKVIKEKLSITTNTANDSNSSNSLNSDELWKCKVCGYFVNSSPCHYCGNITAPYYCGKCGLPGPFSDSCPNCGSSIKKYN